MKPEYLPQSLHIAAFAQHRGQLEGAAPLSGFERLMLDSPVSATAESVHFVATGAVRADAAGEDESWIHLQAHTQMTFVCQRCLGLVTLPVGFDRDFRFVATEALAAVEDEESEEDVLVLSKTFNLLELIEDELLMATPPAPKHDVCPTVLKMEAIDAHFDAGSAPQPNPFAVLDQLKKKDVG